MNFRISFQILIQLELWMVKTTRKEIGKLFLSHNIILRCII